MKIAILSDIHSNFQALKRVLSEIYDIDAIWALGDIVGYGPSPMECLHLIKEKADIVLCGNHDLAVSGGLPSFNFNRYAQAALEYTKKIMDRKGLDYLSGLKPFGTINGITLTHGSPADPASGYILNPESANRAKAALTGTYCFFGHTHQPGIFAYKKGKFHWITLKEEESAPLNEENIFFNPGSVGQPRDNDPRASYAIVDMEKKTWTQKRSEYDIKTVQKKMRGLGSPDFLINRIARGI